MKSNFKPLGIAAAVAVASAGYANVASAAPTVANNALGDLALVPYYTVNGEWLTGIHIVNTSTETQVVKFRFRRATDSMDALDFNIVMSPYDVYAGYLSDDENGVISWQADDTTCTVPATKNSKLTMPPIYSVGAETGYVEIIAMGSADSNQPISKAAKHKAGVPADCEAVRSNFFADGVASTTRGVVDNANTFGVDPNATDTVDFGGDSTYGNSGNVLKVSYFIRDNASGIEFGDNAVHIQDFLDGPAITNQQYGILSGDLNGFDFPDLDGGVPADTASRGRFSLLRGGDVLGVAALINEWTANSANGAALDWVVTMPGQYTMVNMPQYITSLAEDGGWAPTVTADGALATNAECPRVASSTVDACDFRDIPVTATILPYNREEGTLTEEEGDLVVSPAPPGTISTLRLPKETNVITFGGNSVLGVSDVDVSADLGQPYGWLSLLVESASTAPSVWSWVPAEDASAAQDTPNYSAAAGAALTMTSADAGGNVPMIGFAAWARQVAANPDASYGRIVAHSFESAPE